MEPLSLLEEIRFGYGPRWGVVPSPGGVEPDRVLAQLSAADPTATVWSRPGLEQRFALIDQTKADKMAGKDAGDDPNSAAQQLKDIEKDDAASYVPRAAEASLGFVERLVNLWSNRVTVSNTSPAVQHFLQSYRDDAIRPNIGGRYADLVKATIWHPAMQVYLTQTDSIGPNSPIGKRKGRGLNENLAREFLELHTMGHGYTQTDVTELAKLLAGMLTNAQGRGVDDKRAEPGQKLILGVAYGEGMEEIDRLVETVAHREETAGAVAFWLARHFIADDPPADLVTVLTKAYQDNDTALQPMYRLLLQHPAAQSPERQKVRTPHEYIVASLRLMGMNGTESGLSGFPKKGIPIAGYLTSMGQQTYKPLRPDGWPEVAAGWMTPPMMASRLDWGVDLARATGERSDPVSLVDFALGDMASPLLRRAVAGAEQRWEGLAVLLTSPEFSRR